MKLDIDFHKIDLPVELMQICGVSAACVYAVLSDKSNEDGICNLSRNEIAKITGLKNRTIPDLIAKLEVLGIIERQYNPGYATTYHVTNIFPAEQPEEVPAEPARQSEQRHPAELKNGCKYYGEYGWISLTDKEYTELVSEYGKRTVDTVIAEIDNNREANKQYLPPAVRPGAYGKAYIKDWLRKDEKRKNKGKKDIIREQETREVDKYLDLVD